jgi:hypothetical protein
LAEVGDRLRDGHRDDVGEVSLVMGIASASGAVVLMGIGVDV